MIFECVREIDSKSERWQGIILGLREYASHCEFRIEARSGIMVVIGKTIRAGLLVCLILVPVATLQRLTISTGIQSSLQECLVRWMELL